MTSKTWTQTQSTADRLSKDTPKVTTSHELAYQKGKKKKTHLLSQERRDKSLTTWSLQKPLDQLHSLRIETKKKKQEDLHTYSLGKGNLKYTKLDKMKRQRNIVQMKEQGKTTQYQINKEEIWELPKKEFRKITVKMIQNVKNTMEKCKNLWRSLTRT